MEKKIIIDGKEIGFKSSAAFIMKYRSYFGSDGLLELQNLGRSEGLEAMITMQRIIWCLAKNYNKKISTVENWLDNFEDFDLEEIYTELEPLVVKSFGTTEKLEDGDSETSEQVIDADAKNV